jgi:hypothetical protein
MQRPKLYTSPEALGQPNEQSTQDAPLFPVMQSQKESRDGTM